MNLRKFSPWNWFRREQQEHGELMPAGRPQHPVERMHREIDRMFEGFPGMRDFSAGLGESAMLRPSVDISESKKAYRISVEVPGVEESDLDLTVEGHDLVISGEKRREAEDEEDGVHRIERSYGSFRRILSLPADADPDGINARFGKGVLKIKVPRKAKGGEGDARRVRIGGGG